MDENHLLQPVPTADRLDLPPGEVLDPPLGSDLLDDVTPSRQAIRSMHQPYRGGGPYKRESVERGAIASPHHDNITASEAIGIGLDLVRHIAAERSIGCGRKHLRRRPSGDEQCRSGEAGASSVDPSRREVGGGDSMVEADTIAKDRRGFFEALLKSTSIPEPPGGNISHAMADLG